MRPPAAADEWPLGYERKPSSILYWSVCRQMSAETSCPVMLCHLKPPTTYLLILLQSGSHRDRRSGRGLPNRFFIELVKNHDSARDRARPRTPTWSSQSLRCQIRVFGVPLGTVIPGTRVKETTTTMAKGTPTARTKRRYAGTSSCSAKGYLRMMLACRHELGAVNI